MMMHSLRHRTIAAATFFLSLFADVVGASGDATSYFSNLAIDEKETYTSWLTEHSSSYPRHSFMASADDVGDGAAIFWNINDEEDTIHLGVAVRADGWVGFGISEAGGMIGADMALYQVTQPGELIDAHVLDSKSMPMKDDCQNWNLKRVTNNEDGWIIVEMSRLLDTGDAQDHVIKNDEELYMPPTRIIAAWGDSDTTSYHGGKKSRDSVRFFANHSNGKSEMQALRDTLEEESDGHFEVFQDQFEIPAEETTYHELCIPFNELDLELAEGQNSVTMIGAMPFVTEETREYVHHFTVYAMSDCDSWTSFLTRTMIYGWAPGDEGWALPTDVGFPLFDNPNNQAIFISIHYNNPDLIAGKKDSSGLKFFYKNEPRKYEAGILEVGDPWMSLEGEPIDDGLTQYTFTCPSACSSTFLATTERSENDQGVTVISEILHMHKTGTRMTNELIRDGKVINKAVSDVYDFDQQGLLHVPQDFYQVLPGDEFRTSCYYKDGTSFGLGSQEEMCIAFVMYYPVKKGLAGAPWICPYEPFRDFGTGCAGELESATLNSSDELDRNFGKSLGECTTDESTVEDSSGITGPTNPGIVPNSPSATDVPSQPTEEATVTASQPTQSPTPKVINIEVTIDDSTSGAGLHGLSFVLPSVAIMLMAIFM